MIPESALHAKVIISIQDDFSSKLHGEFKESDDTDYIIVRFIKDLHKINFDIWHEEDIIRSSKTADEIVQCKRKIDEIDQLKNDLIEQIDTHLNTLVMPDVRLPWNSETPGNIINRLSILSLKIYHVEERIKSVDKDKILKCTEKLVVLKQQREDLGIAFDILLSEIFERKKQLKIFKRFRIYN